MAAHRLTLADVVSEALVLLEDGGLDAVSLREIARRLDVHLNSVSFQVKSKGRLLELMADAMLGEVSLADLPVDGRPRAEEIVRRYRAALLAHRDGARLVAGTSAVESNTLRVGDALVGALLESGADERTTVNVFWSLHYLLIGLVVEEQAQSVELRDALADGIRSDEYPSLTRVATPLLAQPFEDRFVFGLAAILDRLFG